MPAASLAFSPKLQFFDANGNPLVGGKLHTYAAGTSNKLATYTDDSGTVAAANPIILDSRGECSVWLSSAKYKFTLTTAADVEIWTVDDINASTLVLTDATGLPLTSGVTGILPIANGGTNASSAAQAFSNIKQTASTTATGVVELATDAETQTGTDAARAVTPAGLASVVASATLRGLVELATNAEAQAGTDSTRAVTPAALVSANPATLGPVQTTIGTAIALTVAPLPATAKRVVVVLDGVSTNGTSPVLIRLIDATPLVVSSGYTGVADNAYGTPTAYTTGIGIERTSSAAGSRVGTLTLHKIQSNTWVASYLGTNGTDMCLGSSRVALSSALGGVQITTVGGTDTFDAGFASVFWE